MASEHWLLNAGSGWLDVALGYGSGVASVKGNFGLPDENGGGSGSEPRRVLMNGGLELRKYGLHPQRILRENRFSAQFADVIIQTASTDSHYEKVQFGGEGYILNTRTADPVLYPGHLRPAEFVLLKEL
ncbi:MAG: hypothetical protein DMG79_06780 [Acidobacteria bacterium]|nr:MAG: hypothetical protein DMG79_06780 [Acidobacteriota bacterium]